MIKNDNKNDKSTINQSIKLYECKLCDYTCSNLSNFKKHLQTQKHKDNIMVKNDNKNYHKSTIKAPTQKKDRVCSDLKWKCICGRSYKYCSGLSRHKKTCKIKLIESENIATDDIRSTLNRVVEENRELRDLIIEQQKQISNTAMGNTTHNTYNLQVFLTEGCKDAINMSEFIESLPIQMHDLEHTRKHGLHQGIAQIMVNGLKQLGASRRPIHCTNVKQETLYIKDNGTWARGIDSKIKLQESLKTLAAKQRKAVKEWEELNPQWEQSEGKTQEWMHLVKNVMTGFEEDSIGEGRVMREIAKETQLSNENMIIKI